MFFIFITITIIFLVVINSKIELQIENLNISTIKKENSELKSKIYINLIIFNNIRIFKKDITKIKNKKGGIRKVLTNLSNKKINLRSSNLIEIIKGIKNLKIQLKQIDLYLEIGTEDAALTAILIGIISTILGILIKPDQIKRKSNKFKICPIYKDKNILNMQINCIIRFNLIHYIYKNILKGREKNERKPSNRRSYAYSHEQYT